MAAKTIQVLERGTILSQKTYEPNDFGAQGKWAIFCSRLQGGLSEGVDTIDVSNGELSFVVLPTRGMGLWKASLPGWRVGWQSPVRGPVHPSFVDLGEPSGLGWLDGFDELLVRCGLESNGAPEFDDISGRLKHPLHGRIANKPAHSVSVSFDPEREEISVRGVVEESRFHFFKLRLTSTYTTRLGSTTIQIRDEIENLSTKPAEAQLLYHVNFGLPLLDAGSQVVGPFKTVVPRNAHAASGVKGWNSFQAPEPNYEEQVYFTDLHADKDGRTRTLLKNAHGTQGISLVYNVRQLPCFSLWKNTVGETDGYVTGLEPATNYPNPRSFEARHNRVMKLDPGGRTTFDLAMEIHPTADDVKQAEQAALAIAAGQKPTIHDEPLPEWCAI